MPITVGQHDTVFDPIPEGLHKAVCCDVQDLGEVDTSWGKKRKVEVRWQLDLVNEKTKKRFIAPRRYGASLSKKADLRKDLEVWRGRPFTELELKGFDLENLLGANCQVMIQQKPGDEGSVYSNVVSVVPLGKGMEKMRAEEYVRMADRDSKGPAAKGPDPADEPADKPPF
jgi:hypothetical protein